MLKSKFIHTINQWGTTEWLLGAFGAIVVFSLSIGLITDTLLYSAAIPAFLLLAYLTVVDFRLVFFLLLACIPLSTEIVLPNGFGTDLPTEPLMVGLMFVFMLYAIQNGRTLRKDFLLHPISLILLIHIGWIFIATIFSSQLFVSVKFLLAKIWYVTTFYFLAGYLIKSQKDIRQLFWFIFIPLLFTILVIIAKHAGYGFEFQHVYKVLHPFYRNHVAYASIMAVFLPFLWFIRYWYRPYSSIWWLLFGSVLLILVAIQLSYTRAAYVAVLLSIGAYFAIQYKLMKYLLALGLVVGITFTLFLVVNNRYLEFAPNFEKTITHTNFNNLLEATYQMEDVSTVERFYRWIAGAYMSKEKPIFGFGPGNFLDFYKPYTVSSFRTYVSYNPERSGIHSYYLMTLVEQGYIGLILFLLLVIIALLKGEMIYHKLKDKKDKQIVMMALLSLIAILGLLIINDLIETDKIGPFFFINLAILVKMNHLANGQNSSPSKT